MIGLLRFVGIVNAAIWLGAAIFFTFGAGPAIFSGDMRTLLGANNFPFFSGAIARIILNSYFHFQIACGVVALLHLAAGKLYLGRPVSKFTVGLLTSLLAITLLGGFWLQPKMHDLHVRGYSPKVSVGERATAMHSFRVWHGISQVINLFVIGGIIVYVWRVNNPPNPTQFVRPGSKFGG